MKKSSKVPSTQNFTGVTGSFNHKEMHPLVDHLVEESIYNQSADLLPKTNHKESKKDALRIGYANHG